jgi:hypothetical protein
MCDRHFIFSTSHNTEPSQRGHHADTQLFSSLLAISIQYSLILTICFASADLASASRLRKQEFVAEFDTVRGFGAGLKLADQLFERKA